MREYWAQWSQAELMSMHGVEIDDCNECERPDDYLYDLDNIIDYESDRCRSCKGRGCVACWL